MSNASILEAMISLLGRDNCLEPDGKLMLPDKVGFMKELMNNVLGLYFNLRKMKGKTFIYEGHEIKVLHLTFIQWYLENVEDSPLPIDRFDAIVRKTNDTTMTVIVNPESIPKYHTKYAYQCRNMSPLVENKA